MRWAALVLVALSLAACSDDAPAPHPYDGAAVARICRDGSYIYRYVDGTYHTNHQDPVYDVEKVCQ